jgi:hypothetical protein
MNKVLWNNEMDLCIGLKTEMDLDEFRDELKMVHYELTGESISSNDGVITEVGGLIWKFELNW